MSSTRTRCACSSPSNRHACAASVYDSVTYGFAATLNGHDVELKRRPGCRSATYRVVRCCSTLACASACQGRFRSPRVVWVHSVISSSTSVENNGASFSTPCRAKRLTVLADHLTSAVLSTKRVGNLGATEQSRLRQPTRRLSYSKRLGVRVILRRDDYLSSSVAAAAPPSMAAASSATRSTTP